MSTHSSWLLPLLSEYDLRVACAQCCQKQKQITYVVKPVAHRCAEDLLLCRTKGGGIWRPVSQRPKFPNPSKYKPCHFFVEGYGCQQHRNRCTFASSIEEATVWTFEKRHALDRQLLCHLLAQSAEAAAVWNCQRDKKVTVSKGTQAESAERAAELIRQQFPGKFLKVCKVCFQSHPQILATRRWNATCSAEAAHPWDPVLVHYVSESAGKHVCSRLRPLPQDCSFTFCSHVCQGKPCWHPDDRCQAAQSAVEMAAWKAEHGGLNIRPHLVNNAYQASQNLWYCKVCLLVFSSPEGFYKHCSSLEHTQLASEDTRTKRSGRKPPHNRRDQLSLCDR